MPEYPQAGFIALQPLQPPSIGAMIYVPTKEIVPPSARVRLSVAGVTYPDTAPQVIVYVPVGFESEDCEVPEPVIVAGPVIVQEAEMFEETFILPTPSTTTGSVVITHP